MPPKFQSTFIPSGPAAVSGASYNAPAARRKQKDLFSFISSTLFTLSVVLALGVFGYKFFLNYRIGQMGVELENARAALQPEAVTELIRLNSRLVSTQTLVKNHRILSPVFDFLEAATPQNVRYTDFNFSVTPKGLDLKLRGEARSYTALAAAAEIYNRTNSNFKNPAFSDLELDQDGNVLFSLDLKVEPELLSFERIVEGMEFSDSAVMLGATTTPVTATSSGVVVPGGLR